VKKNLSLGISHIVNKNPDQDRNLGIINDLQLDENFYSETPREFSKKLIFVITND
jgi:hypothetical protein